MGKIIYKLRVVFVPETNLHGTDRVTVQCPIRLILSWSFTLLL